MEKRWRKVGDVSVRWKWRTYNSRKKNQETYMDVEYYDARHDSSLTLGGYARREPEGVRVVRSHDFEADEDLGLASSFREAKKVLESLVLMELALKGEIL